MERFSQRIGKAPTKVDFQTQSMDSDLRNSLWSAIHIYIAEPMQETQQLEYSEYSEFINKLWFRLFKQPIDTIPNRTAEVIHVLRESFFNENYLFVYDLIDFIPNVEETPYESDDFIETVNSILKTELSGYRFMNGQLAPIIQESEIKSIENSIEVSSQSGFSGVKIHLTSSLSKLSDRTNPDYRNSIKESISAVESLCQSLTGDDSAELGKAIKLLEEKMPIHGALKSSLVKLYGYTSDGDGIRHALLEEDNLDQEDALFMLVSCSAFINYLIIKAQKSGIVKSEN